MAEVSISIEEYEKLMDIFPGGEDTHATPPSNVSEIQKSEPGTETAATSSAGDSGSKNSSEDSESQAVVSEGEMKGEREQNLSDEPPTATQTANDNIVDGDGAETASAAAHTSNGVPEAWKPGPAWICCECSSLNVETRLPCCLCDQEYCVWCIPAVL